MYEAKKMENEIQRFHREIREIRKWLFSVKGKDRLEILKFYSNEKYRYKNGQSTAQKRKRFTELKNIKKLWKRRCLVCYSRPTIRHHIISLNNGGINNTKNIIPICSKCHSEIHPWLKEKMR